MLATASAGIGALIAGCAFLESDETSDENSTDNRSDSAKATISVSDQIAHDRLRLDAVETAVDAHLEIVDEEGNSLAATIWLDAGGELADYGIEYTEPLEQPQTVTVRLVDGDDGGVIESASASVLLDLVNLTRGEVQFVEAEPDLGFNYPYFAYVPDELESSGPVYVEPNNTGIPSDDFDVHRSRAEDRIDSDSWRREVPERLGVPYLVPIFPRPRRDPVSWRHYVHALDAETMQIDDGPLERVDLQLLAMVDHYRASLEASIGYDATPEFHLNGFSASGNFVNRFAALHPERVRAVTAGGVNGTLILPLERDGGHDLPYPIGVADVGDLTGDEFDEATWSSVPQFIYMGSADENDTIPYDDAWNDTLRSIALDVYGEDMQDDRMPYCESVYDDAGANAQIHVYQDVGHTVPNAVKRDIYEFHRQHLDPDAAFEPIEVRDAPDLDVSFASNPRDGDTSITIQITVPEDYLLDGKFSDGSVAPMLDTGTEIDWRDRISLSGDRHMRPDDMPVDEVRTFETERPLESGEQVTVGLMDGSIVASETVTVE